MFVLEGLKCFHWIPRPEKCGFSLQNHVSSSIGSKVIVNMCENIDKNPLKPQKNRKTPNSANIPRGQFLKWYQRVGSTRKPYDSHQNFCYKCHRSEVS